MAHALSITKEGRAEMFSGRGSVPDGLLDGCNVRAAFNDAAAFNAVLSTQSRPKPSQRKTQVRAHRCRYCGQPEGDGSGVCARCERKAA